MSPTTLRRAAGLLLLFAAVAGVYAPSVRNRFLRSDVLAVRAPTPPGSLADALSIFGETREHAASDYRPLPRATILVQRYLHGSGPAPYRLFNALAVALVALAACGLLRSPGLRVPPAVAWLGAALFAVHPVASEAVYPVADGRAASIGALLSIAATWAWLRPGRASRVLALVLLAGALVCGSECLVLPAIFVVADLAGIAERGRGAPLVRYLPVAGIVLAYAALRLAAAPLGQVALAVLDDPAGPPLSLLFALQSILDPAVALAPEPPPARWFALGHVVVVLLAGFALAVWARRRWGAVRRPVLFWLGWFLLFLVPTSNVFAQQVRFAERQAFLASLGVIGIAATLVSTLWSQATARRITIAVAVLLGVGAAAISVHRGGYYENEAVYLQQWLRSDPDSVRARFRLAGHYRERDMPERAIQELQRVLRVEPEHTGAHIGLGVLLAERGELQRAEEHLTRAVQLAPERPDAQISLALLYEHDGRRELAATHFERAARLDPGNAPLQAALGELYLELGDVRRADERLEEAVRLDPGGQPQAHFDLGNIALREDDAASAEFHFDRAALIDPQHAPAHNNLAIVLARRGERERAQLHFERALAIDPDYAQAHVNYGNFLLAEGDRVRALEHLERAVAIDPDSAAARDSLEHARQAASGDRGER